MADTRTPFLDAIFRGARFESHELPVDVLQELSAYRELVLAVAKELFLRANPDRKRVPKGFSEKLRLALAGIEPGSARACLTRIESVAEHQQQMFLAGEPEPDHFELARSLAGEAIAAANDNQPLPDAFPRHLVPMFNQFGRHLDGSEAIELRPPGSESGPRYSVDTRRVLLQETNQELEAAFLGYARIAGAEIEPTRACKFLLPDGRTVKSPLPEAVETTVLPALAEYRDTWLRVRGTARFDRHDRVLRLDELEDVSVVDDKQSLEFDRAHKRLTDLMELEDGWQAGAGDGLAGKEMGWVLSLLLLLLGETDLPKPGIYPTLLGGVQMEWAKDDLDVTLVFDLTENVVRVEVTDGDDDAQDIEPVQRRHAERLTEILRPLVKRLQPGGASDE